MNNEKLQKAKAKLRDPEYRERLLDSMAALLAGYDRELEIARQMVEGVELKMRRLSHQVEALRLNDVELLMELAKGGGVAQGQGPTALSPALEVETRTKLRVRPAYRSMRARLERGQPCDTSA